MLHSFQLVRSVERPHHIVNGKLNRTLCREYLELSQVTLSEGKVC